MAGSLLAYLNKTAETFPEKVAFAGSGEALTFRELRALASNAGGYLRGKGLNREPVAVLLKRSPREIAAFFGVTDAGCFYVPLDEEMPEERQRSILETTRARFLLSDEENYQRAKALLPAERVIPVDEAFAYPGSGVLCEDAVETDPLYVVFTSGSTGVPKGVAASHRNVIDYGEQLLNTLGIDESAVLGCQSPLYFDACLKEILAVIMKGAAACLIPRSLFVQPVALVNYLNDNKINALCWVSSAFSLVSRLGTFQEVKPRYLKLICFGSEVFPPKQLTLWQQACPKARFFNLYGPTECTGMSCYYEVKRAFKEEESIPIGRPFPNRRVLLLNEEGREGPEGEICIGGAGVTLGYYNDPERTAAAFVQNPLNRAYPERLYRTGDLAKRDSGGELLFIGRLDQQIKHMGHRIELGEVEKAASALPGVGAAVCLYRQKDQRLLLLYVGEGEPGEALQGLRKKLPAYMVPSKALRLTDMPRTPNGKADRRYLQEKYAF